MQNTWETIIPAPQIHGLPYNQAHTNYAEIFYPSIVSNANNFTLNAKIKDVIGTPAATGLSNFTLKLIHDLSTPPLPTAQIIGFSNAWESSTQPEYTVPYVNGMVLDFTIERLVLPGVTVAAGEYTLNFDFEIWGKNSTNIDVLIDSYRFKTLIIQRADDKNPFCFTHYNDFKFTVGVATLPTKDLYLFGKKIIVPAEFVLSSTDPNITTSVNSNGLYQAVLSGPFAYGKLVLGLNPSFLTAPPQTKTNYLLDNESNISGTTYTSTTNASIEILANDVTNLTFEGVLNLIITPSQQIVNFNPALLVPFPVATTSSPWINFTLNSTEIDINTTFNGINAPGTYTGVINVTQAGVLKHQINVTFIVKNWIQIDYQTPFPFYGFTLDPKFISFNATVPNSYFQFDCTVITAKYFTGNTHHFEIIKQKIVPFNGFAKTNIGLMVHKLMDRFKIVNATPDQYFPASVTISCQEKLLSNDTVINTIEFPINFLAGLTKVDLGGSSSNSFMLGFNYKPRRVTKNSFAFINYFVNVFNDFEIHTWKNNVLINQFQLNGLNNNFVHTQTEFFNMYQPGDEIEFRLISTDLPNFMANSRKFIVFPESRYSNMIVWEDEFLLQDALEFTGSHNITTDIEFVDQKLYHNLVEHLEILDTTKDVKLTINTGWLLKTDIDSIESLMRSKRAWIDDINYPVELRPRGKKIINEDSERELIEYTIEFLINRKYNEETYTL